MFHFSCHTFYKVVNDLFYLSYVSDSLFELPILAWHTTWLSFQLSGQLFSASSVVSGISLTNCPYILLFFHSLSSNSVWIPSYSVYRFILFFLQLTYLQWMAQLNSWHNIPICFPPSLYIPHNLSIPFLLFPY